MATSTTSVRQNIRFVEAPEPVLDPVTKFGGQPCWLGEPQWPLSAELGRPMRFLGQIRLAGEEVRLAYLFLTESFTEDSPEGTWDPRGGENAFFAQPGDAPDFYQVAAIRRGPTFGPDQTVELSAHEGGQQQDDFGSRLWGEPTWLQEDDSPSDAGTWRFVLQLDSADELPFDVNFGDSGVGYAFVNEQTGEGRFCWQRG